MKMLRKFVVIGTLTVLATGCSKVNESWHSAKNIFHKNTTTVSAPPEQDYVPYLITRQASVSEFNGATIEGPFDVEFVQSNQANKVLIEGYSNVVDSVQPMVIGDQLHIELSREAVAKTRSNIKLTIHTPHLHNLVYRGDGELNLGHFNSALMDVDIDGDTRMHMKGKIGLRKLAVGGSSRIAIHGVDSNNLTVSMSGSPNIELDGMVSVKAITAEGSGMLRILWVDSDELSIAARENPRIILAGVVNRLVAKLDNQATLDAKYLRAEDAFVKTYGESVAEVSVVNAQNVVALDKSNIYYYNEPNLNVDFMGDEGSVLDMQQAWLVDEESSSFGVAMRNRGMPKINV